MISNKYANILTQISDNSMHGLNTCADMPDRINLAGTINSINDFNVTDIIDKAHEFIRQFDRELDTGFLTENDLLRNGYALRTVDHLMAKWWPIYYVACITCDSIEAAQWEINFTENDGVPTVRYTELGAKTSAVLHTNRQTTLGLIGLFTECVSIAVKYICRFYPQLLTQHLDKLGGFIENIQPTMQPVVNKDNQSDDNSNVSTKKLIDIFEHTSKFKKIMELLVEQGHCQPGTYIWIDAGAGHKNSLASLIKHLHAQGFYTNNEMPSNEKIVSLVKNTFGVKIGIDTAKKAKADDPTFAFIGPATTY